MVFLKKEKSSKSRPKHVSKFHFCLSALNPSRLLRKFGLRRFPVCLRENRGLTWKICRTLTCRSNRKRHTSETKTHLLPPSLFNLWSIYFRSMFYWCSATNQWELLTLSSFVMVIAYVMCVNVCIYLNNILNKTTTWQLYDNYYNYHYIPVWIWSLIM